MLVVTRLHAELTNETHVPVRNEASDPPPNADSGVG